MIQKILFLGVIAAVYCQYPRQRAPPMYQGPPSEEYAEEYDPSPRLAPPPRQAPPQPAMRPNQRNSDLLRPASVHYVNIGAELAGDYKFGYDTGKGQDGQSFREETRLPDGSVQGAYGYIDETGTQRIVKYIAGKDGFKVLKDGEDGASRAAPSRQAAPSPASQTPNRLPPRQEYVPQPQPAPRPQPQPAYRPPPQPQQAYRPPPQPQPAYRPPPPQPAYAPEPQNYTPRQRSQAPRRQQAPKPVVDYDYEDPNNEITERRLVPVDTSLFNYDIGLNKNSRK